MANFQELLDTFAFQAFEKQRRLSLLIGEHTWLLDSEKATLAFDNQMVFPVHFLGTESASTRTWLWADSNESITLPPSSLDFCRTVRATGRAYGANCFSHDRFEFSDEVGAPDGHTLAMVSTCLGGGSCYYRCPHENGAVFVIITDALVDSQPNLDQTGFHEAYMSLMWVAGDMKKRLVSYLSEKGYIDKSWNGKELLCKLYTGEQIGVRFAQTEGGGTTISLLEGQGKDLP